MRTKIVRSVLLGLFCVLALSFAISARSKAQDDTIWGRAEKALKECLKSEHHDNNVNTPLKLVGAIAPPGANFAGYDIGFVNDATEQYFVTEGGPNIVPTPTTGQTNASGAVDVLDAENDLVAGRITGFYGRYAPGCAGPDGMGPSGVLVTPDNRLVVDSLTVSGGVTTGAVYVFDLNTVGPTPYNFTVSAAIVPPISTHAACRADELAYDPKDRILIVGNPADTPSPSVSFISLNTYSFITKVAFPTATYPKVSGIEQSVWDSQLNGGAFITNVPGVGLVVFNPTTQAIEKIYSVGPTCVGTGLVLGPFQKLLVGCTSGGPLQIVNALTGNLIALVPEIPSMDEGWYDPGDGRFYAPSGTLEQVGVIDAETNTALTPFPPARTGVRSVAAFSENNHVFVIWPPPSLVSATVLAGSDATKDPCNTMFNLPANAGCIAVYNHDDEAAEAAANQ